MQFTGHKSTTLNDFSVSNKAIGLDLGDLNGDGKDDLIIANGSDETVTAYLNDGSGNFYGCICK